MFYIHIFYFLLVCTSLTFLLSLLFFCYFSLWLATFLAFVTVTAVCGRKDPRNGAALVPMYDLLSAVLLAFSNVAVHHDTHGL